MRILKFFSVFLVTAIVIFGFVIGWNWKSFSIFIENRDALSEGNEWIIKTSSLRGLSEFMGENPQYTSVVSIVVDHPDSSIHYNPNELRVMGTTANIFILAAYSLLIDRGDFSPETTIRWSDVSRYQLPDVDASVHRGSYRTGTNRSWITDDHITLHNALLLLAESNDLALADYLWWKISPEIWYSLKTELQLELTEMPLPYSGLYLSISPEFQNESVPDLISRWTNAPETEWREHVTKQSRAFAEDSERREEILGYMNRNRLGNTFMEERNAMILFPKATAEEITTMLNRLISHELINENVSETLMDYMRWPMEQQSGIERDFQDYGAIYDNRMGLMNGIDFGTSSYTGDTTVQALFLDRLPIGFWFHASGGHMHQDFMQRLIYDPALISQMKQVIQ
ncbi:MAG: hypothetical protein JJU37_01210 [Balneolaceae bacterium]|nr:hypothetical protein [Balneolaceae bacterium]